MSKSSVFAAHLTDFPQNSAQLQEASGESLKVVSNRLTVLKGKGLAKRVKDGWISTGVAPTEKREQSTAKKTKQPRAERTVAALVEEEAMFTFFLDDERDIQICRRDGEGEAAIIPRAEAIRLRNFLVALGQVMEAA